MNNNRKRYWTYNSDKESLVKKYLNFSGEFKDRFDFVLHCLTGNMDPKQVNIFALQLTHKITEQNYPENILGGIVKQLKTVRFIVEAQ